MNKDLISRQAAKNKKVYSEERHEYVIPVAEIDWLPSAQPEHTETHSCDYERTATHGWIPVTERLPYHELAIVQYSDGDFDLLKFPTAYRWKDIVAWMPLPEPYKGE